MLVHTVGHPLGKVWNWPLYPEGKEKWKKGADYYRLVGGGSNRQGNLCMRLVLGSLKTGRSLNLPTRILEVSIEALTGLIPWRLHPCEMALAREWWTSQVVLVVKNRLPMKVDIRDAGSILGWEDPLEEGTTTPSSILAWRVPWTRSLGSIGSQSQTQLKQLSIHGMMGRMYVPRAGKEVRSLRLPVSSSSSDILSITSSVISQDVFRDRTNTMSYNS